MANVRLLGEFLRSEKGTYRLEPQRKYCFRVDPHANKLEIRRAVETTFNVQVTSVRTMRMHGKLRRVRRALGKQPDWKKAIITVAPEQKIEVT